MNIEKLRFTSPITNEVLEPRFANKPDYDSSVVQFLSGNCELGRELLRRHWSDSYRTSVEDENFPETDCITTQENYYEFGTWMVHTLEYRQDIGDRPLWDFGSSEDRLYYRSFCVAKGIGGWKNHKLNFNVSMDEHTMVYHICLWYRLGLIDTCTLISSMNIQPGSDTGRVLDWNPETQRWDKNQVLSV